MVSVSLGNQSESSLHSHWRGHMLRKLLLPGLAALGLALPELACSQEKNPPPHSDCRGDALPAGVLARLGTVQFTHGSLAAFSPDGKIVVTADHAGVHVCEYATGKKLRLLPVKDNRPAVGLVFSHSGKKLAVILSGGASVDIWDVATFQKTVLTQSYPGLRGLGDWSHAAAFSTDDKTLYCASESVLFHWDVASGKKLQEIPLRHNDAEVDFALIAFSADGKVAATHDLHKVLVWETATGKLKFKIADEKDGHESPMCWVFNLLFSGDGSTLVVPGHSGLLDLWDVKTGKKTHALANGWFHGMAFSPDGKALATATTSDDENQGVQLWNLTDLKAPPVKFPAPGIDTVIFSPDGMTLAWGSHGQSLCFMDRRTGKDLRPTTGHRGAIGSLVYLPDGQTIATASVDGTIRTWDAATGKSLRVFHGHKGPINALALSPNGKHLASGGMDGSVRIWDMPGGELRSTSTEHYFRVQSVAFSPDGKWLATQGNGRIYLRNPNDGKSLNYIHGFDENVAFSGDSKTLTSLDHEGKLLLRELGTEKTAEVEMKGGDCLAYSPNGKFLAVAQDGMVSLIDAINHTPLRTLPVELDRQGCVVFSPDSRYLATVSDSWKGRARRRIRVFELASGTQIHTFESEVPVCAAFSPDGWKLAVGGGDTLTFIWDLKNLTGKKRPTELLADQLTAHWDRLAAKDAAEAYEARADLFHAPSSALALMAKRLQPAPAVDSKRVDALIKDLGSDNFASRQKAFKALQEMGELVRELMRKAILTAKPSIEARRRLRTLLGRLDQATPAQLRAVRSVEILEAIGNLEARQILERLAHGNADSVMTQESRTALERLTRK